MLTVVHRRGVFAGIVTAILGLLVALPFTIGHPVAPFTILLVTFGVVMALRRFLGLPKYATAYWAGCLAALVMLLPISALVKFAEQGFNEGPFYGQVYTDGVTGLEVGDRLEYRNGDLVVYNRQAQRAPVLTYRVGQDLRWAVEMDVSQAPAYENYHLSKIEDLSLFYGILRDRIDFTGEWDFGSERGRIFLWKWGQFQKFYLGW